MLKAVVFDFDGVLADSEPLHYKAFAEVATGFVELDYQTYLTRFIGYDDRDTFRVMLTGKPEPGDQATEARVAELIDAKQQAFAHLVKQGAASIDGAWELVEQLAGHMPLAIASGATRMDIDLILDKLGKADRFDAIVTANDVSRSKPHPESYATAVTRLAGKHETLNLTPGECLAIEDTAAGIASAQGAGLLTVGVTTTGPASQLQAAHRVVESPAALSLSLLREWFGG